jgi:L-asparaginase II
VTDPVLVEVMRGDIVESVHRGVVAVAEPDGRIHLSLGDIDRPVFPRSAVKAIQALPLVESGAADAFGFGDRELALACASHDGEPEHVELARAMLAKAGLEGSALECGAHWPTRLEATLSLAREGQVPSALHNNCSGKHSGFLCTCVHLGIDHRGYVAAGHRSQEMVRDAMEAVTGARHAAENRAIDGCSIPTYAVPLRSLAHGFARMATGTGLPPERAAAARRLMSACMAEPFYVDGTEGADTRLMQAAPGRVFVKTGAEGVYCAALPELGLGMAIKCDDGAGRAAQAIVAALLAKLLKADAEPADTFSTMSRPPLHNRNGFVVGAVRPTPLLTN